MVVMRRILPGCRYTEDIVDDLEVKLDNLSASHREGLKSCQNTMAIGKRSISQKTVREEAAHQRRKGTNRRVSGP